MYLLLLVRAYFLNFACYIFTVCVSRLLNETIKGKQCIVFMCLKAQIEKSNLLSFH